MQMGGGGFGGGGGMFGGGDGKLIFLARHNIELSADDNNDFLFH